MKKKKKLKIGLFSSSFLPSVGGVEVGLHNIAMFLKEKGHVPTVITAFSHANKIKSKKIKLPYKVIGYPPKVFSIMKILPSFSGRFLDFFYTYLHRKYRFDFWHATFIYPIGISIINFCNKKNINYLIRGVGEDIQIDKKLNYGMRLDKEINNIIVKKLSLAKNLVAVSKSIKIEYKKLNIPKNKILDIPNGINLKRITKFKHKKELRDELGIKKSSIVFLSIGRFHPKKNFELIIKAINNLKHKNLNLKVLIAGVGVKNLNYLLEKYSLEKYIILYEPQYDFTDKKKIELNFPSEEILSLYKLSNVFIMPSIIESFGIVTVEAMGFGLPIIINNSPGSRDVVRNGKDAFLFDGKIKSLQTAIENFYKKKSLRKKYANKSIIRSKDFDWSNVVDRYIRIYRRKT